MLKVDGIINVLKPPGVTSHDIVSKVRRLAGQKKVGHGGTLDPGAAGVLPVFLGSATRLIEYAMEDAKAYRVEMTLGASSLTGDDSSPVEWTNVENYPTREAIEGVLNAFLGKTSQVPPMYSALKVEGKKLYELAREGKTIERQPREIEITSIELIDYQAPVALFDVECSKGTYIRTLCEDIGKALEIPCLMTFLLRTRVGSFEVANSVILEEGKDLSDSLLEPEWAVRSLEKIDLTEAGALNFCSGQPVILNLINPPKLFGVYNGKLFIGIGKLSQGVLKPEKVLVDVRKMDISR